jgi:hypothetical protein
MTNFEFTTDRTYDGAQRITGTIVQIDDAGFAGMVDVTVEFHDTSRYIRGRAWLPMMPEGFTVPELQRSLMQSYDAGQYDSI